MPIMLYGEILLENAYTKGLSKLLAHGPICLRNLDELLEVAETEAENGCGLSEVLYDARVQSAYANILGRAMDAEHAEIEVVLRKRGYNPESALYQAAEGECRLTGLDEDCCPCGRH